VHSMLQPRSAFWCLALVHRVDLERQERVDLTHSARPRAMTGICAKRPPADLGFDPKAAWTCLTDGKGLPAANVAAPIRAIGSARRSRGRPGGRRRSGEESLS
jgi:hypothetical protein